MSHSRGFHSWILDSFDLDFAEPFKGRVVGSEGPAVFAIPKLAENNSHLTELSYFEKQKIPFLDFGFIRSGFCRDFERANVIQFYSCLVHINAFEWKSILWLRATPCQAPKAIWY